MKRKNESGVVVVEAAIVVTLVLVFITAIFLIGMTLYQQASLSVMANYTASTVSQVYSNTIKDPFTGYIDPESVYQSVTYSNMKTDAYLDVMNQKARTLALYRLKTSAILPSDNTEVDVQIVKKPNELLKSQIIVTIKEKYSLPLISFFGSDNGIEFSATGRADCVDILEYLNGVEAVGDPENSSVTHLPDSDTCLVQFFDNKVDRHLIATVPVLRGKSIMTSNHYTHSTLPKNPVSKKFDFTGWKTSSGEDFFATTDVNSNMSVYGAWECLLRFDPTGGTVTPTSKKVEVWSTTTLPVPSRQGYEFIGWFTEANGGGTQFFSNTTIIDDNFTLYAHWRCIHKYQVVKKVPGNCRTKDRLTYKCVQCGDTYEDDGGYGDHNYQYVGKGGYWCYEGYIRYRCSICGAEKTSDAPGVGTHHGYEGDYTGRCNVKHGWRSGTFSCSTQGWNPSTGRYNPCSTTFAYHQTCAFCGAIDIDWRTPWGTQMYWCGLHASGVRPITGCGYGGTKK